MHTKRKFLQIFFAFVFIIAHGCQPADEKTAAIPEFKLIVSDKFYFKSFVDCNMAEAWIGDTFRIFPGKYGEDPLWGYSHELKFTDGHNADEVFLKNYEAFTEPSMPPNVPPGAEGLHGAVWFETVYQDASNKTGKTLFAVYHNENYPGTLPYDAKTRKGYIDNQWPQGITGPQSPAAVCRIGIMKSTDGGHSWTNKGIFIEDLQPRMILKQFNTSKTFAGGVGDPSAVASGNYLYLFYGEYGYAGVYDSINYDPVKEWSGQCISIARIKLSDLENPEGKAKRWDGKAFNAAYDSVGVPISALQISLDSAGGPSSAPAAGYHWGPSVSWNTYLKQWVMLMAHASGPSWQGGRIYISFNSNKDLGKGNNAQQWSKPQLLVDKPGHTIWYPSLQPINSDQDIANRNTSLNLGQTARLFYKDMFKDSSQYISEYVIKFE
ncbi:hypothetical protein BH10BAC2_BH10BAC2_40070 [soil metagenome]